MIYILLRFRGFLTFIIGALNLICVNQESRASDISLDSILVKNLVGLDQARFV